MVNPTNTLVETARDHGCSRRPGSVSANDAPILSVSAMLHTGSGITGWTDAISVHTRVAEKM